MSDATLWQSTMGQLPSYLDGDGLASYFPLAGDGSGRAARGSDTLTAHLLNLSALAQGVDKRFVLPAAERERMENGLIAFVEGRSEEHTSELQSQSNLVCRLLLEKKKNT